MKARAKSYEGSPDDEKKDKKAAKLFGMSKKAYEKSPINKAADKIGQKKLGAKRGKGK